MKIMRALGLGLAIIIAQFLIADIFHAFSDAAVQLFQTAETAFEQSEASIHEAYIP